VGIIVASRLLLVDGCWSRAQRSLVLERNEGETSNFWKLRPTTTLRYHLSKGTVHSTRPRTMYMSSSVNGRNRTKIGS